MSRSILLRASRLLLLVPLLSFGAGESRLTRVKYNHPDLVVDLGVGLWANPLPMDYDGDGDMDLVVTCDDVPYNGTYFFENTEGAVQLPIFKKAVRIGDGIKNLQISYIDSEVRVLRPGVEYMDFLKNGFSSPAGIIRFDQVVSLLTDAKPSVDLSQVSEFSRNYAGVANIRANQWKYVDFDGDEALDLIIGVGDWNDYGMEWSGSGWENAYDKDGRWRNGPLRGYVYVLKNEGTNAAPSYSSPAKIQAEGKPLEVFGMPSANFADFDDDGDLDILCGEFKDTLTYFENTGSRGRPAYAKGRVVRLGDKPLKFDLCMIVPVVIDWDGDGDLDVVVGEEDGRIAFVENRGGMKNGTPYFRAPVFFEQEADELKFGALSTPVGFDWDLDGDEDLICGNSAGYIGFIENLGGGDNPVWNKPVYVEAGGEIIRIQAGYNGIVQGTSEAKWGYTTLSVSDWNDDDLPDLIVNSSWGKVVWFQNMGEPGAPMFLPEKEVRVAWTAEAPKPAWTWWTPHPNALATQWRTTPVVIDLNRDGLNDLVMLDPEGYLAFYEKQMRDGDPVLLPPTRIFSVRENSVYDRAHTVISREAGLLRLNGERAGRSGRRKLVLADWDGDGDFDLIVNSSVCADLLENVGTENGRIVFKDRGPMDSRDLAGHTTSPAVVDWDGDGRKELLIGAEDGFFYHLPASP